MSSSLFAMAARTRLSPEQRTEQLLDIGAELFSASPYEEVHIERVADLAGVSRGLLYHYFPTKRAFFAALVQRETQKLLAATAADPALHPLDRMAHGITTFLDHCIDHPHALRALRRGVANADAQITAAIADATDAHIARILDALFPTQPAPPLATLTVRSWIEFLRTAGFEAAENPALPRDQIADVCLQALVGALANLPADARPPGLKDLLEQQTH